MKKILIIYYSLEGHTKKIASDLASHINADLYEVKPIKEVNSNSSLKYFFGGKQVLMNKKPKLQSITTDFSLYDIIFVGSPIWAGTFAPPIKTLLECEYFTGKKVAFFYSHRGGARKAEIKAKLSIELFNTFISSFGYLENTLNNEQVKQQGYQWAQSIISKY